MLRLSGARGALGARRLAVAAVSHPDASKLISSLESSSKTNLSQVVPWFAEQMPTTYFRIFGEETQRRHLRAISTLFDDDLNLKTLSLTSHHGGAGGCPGRGPSAVYHTTLSRGAATSAAARLAQQVAALPREAELRRVLVFRSADDRLCLDILETGSADAPFSGEDAEQKAALVALEGYAARLRAGELVGQSNHVPPSAILSDGEVAKFLRRCSTTYVCQHEPRLLYKQMLLTQSVAGTEDVAVEFEDGYEYGSHNGAATLITVALGDSKPRRALQGTLATLDMHGLQVERVLVDMIGDPPSDKPGLPSAGVTLVRAIVRSPAGAVADNTQLANDLRRFKWLDDSALSLAAAHPSLGLERAESTAALATLSLALLDHPLLSRNNMLSLLERPAFAPQLAALSDVFAARFDPTSPMDDAAFGAAIDDFDKSVAVGFQAEESRSLLHAMGRCLRHTMRTNAPLAESRRALALRLDPALFAQPISQHAPHVLQLPYGVFFVAGRHFSSFHVRFADVARGGLRVVAPADSEAHVAESRRHFLECLNLAWAQQLKNKDIPEGGSKGVCLVTPGSSSKERAELLHGSVKATIDGMLDLISPGALARLGEAAEAPADRVGRGPEQIYLGPDENITPDDIDWVVHRAAERGYARPAAFMSSKPAEGINHKEFGVTSEGVAVFLDVALNALGLSPRTEPWSVKLTGGPDGDVAGNMLQILHREYGDKVRIVGMADGSGCAEDPAGLPMAELLRLFEQSLPLSALDRAALSPSGLLTTVDTEEGFHARNSMHNRVVADAFIPAGGRPSAINGSNWRDFLLPDGTPSAKVIVEGANLFVTPEARQALFEECGLPIIKDSSANKCGVICSSLEIAASIVLERDEFVALKPAYVPAVVDRLRALARLEASRIMAESRLRPHVPLPKLSEQLSLAILRVTNAAADALESLEPERKERLWPLMREHLPAPLFDAYSTRIAEALPWEYQKSLIAASLASRLVYREGLSWAESLPSEALPTVCLEYLRQEQRIRQLAEDVRTSSLGERDEVSELLIRGGVRAAVESAEHTRGAAIAA